MMGHIGLMTINAHLYKDMTFNPLTNSCPFFRTTTYANLLIVNNNLPVRSTKELIEYARNRTTPLTFSSAGVGGSLHMGFELLKADADIKAQHVPYTATAKAMMSVAWAKPTPRLRTSLLRPRRSTATWCEPSPSAASSARP